MEVTFEVWRYFFTNLLFWATDRLKILTCYKKKTKEEKKSIGAHITLKERAQGLKIHIFHVTLSRYIVKIP